MNEVSPGAVTGRASRWALFAAAVLVVASLTLSPSSGSTSPWYRCVFCGDRASGDAIANVLLFGPVGFGLGVAGVAAPAGTLIGLAFSASIELLQFAIPGRQPSFGDVLTNTAGTLAGLMFLVAASQHARRPRISKGRICAGAGVVSAAVIVLTGVLLEPSFPTGSYVTQWTPDLGHVDSYHGRVLTASIGSVTLPQGPVDTVEGVRNSLRTREPLQVVAIVGPQPPRLSKLWGINALGYGELVLLGIVRDDLVYRYRTRAVQFRFDRPEVRVRKALEHLAPGDTLTLRVTSETEGVCLATNDTRACGLGFTVGSGWGLILYAGGLPWWQKQALNLGWIAALFAPIGFFFKPTRWGFLGLALPVAMVATVPLFTSLVTALLAEWTAASLGFGLGAVASRVAGSRLRGSEAAQP